MKSTNEWTEHGRRSMVDQLHKSYGASGYASDSLRTFRSRFLRSTWMLTILGAKALKLMMDICISLAALAVLSPLFLVVALCVYLEDGGPILFWQVRVGLHGRTFGMPKFRSMVVDAERRKADLIAQNERAGVAFKMRRDPRVTRTGRIIRKLSIDELPQLWCVLRGDMSLVGPRPALPAEVARYDLRDRRRLDVKPGLTCIWQVSGRGELAFDQQVKLDEKYIDNHNLVLDLILLVRTIPAVLTGRGAY